MDVLVQQPTLFQFGYKLDFVRTQWIVIPNEAIVLEDYCIAVTYVYVFPYYSLSQRLGFYYYYKNHSESTGRVVLYCISRYFALNALKLAFNNYAHHINWSGLYLGAYKRPEWEKKIWLNRILSSASAEQLGHKMWGVS